MTSHYSLFTALSSLLLLLSTLVAPPIYAQKRTAARLTREQRLANIDSLLRDYQFAAALPLIEAELKTSETGGLQTDTLEAWLQTAENGERMLLQTAQVEFVDSFLCTKSSILTYVRPSAGAGQIALEGSEPQGLTYTNDFGDLQILSRPTDEGVLRLFSRIRLGAEWGEPQLLVGLCDRDARAQVAPYQLSDGMSLYYAEESDEGLGGLDIYVTRMGPLRSYLRPENLGMPFNSPANDYLYVVDEQLGLGWFVTDRRQSGDTVCVYVFIPPTTRRAYADGAYDDEQLRSLARIASIADAAPEEEALNAARDRLKQAIAAPNTSAATSDFCFELGDGRVITEIQLFGTAEAMQAAIEWDNARRQNIKLEQQLLTLRDQWHDGNHSDALRKNILSLEAQREVLLVRIAQLANQIRQAEL